MRDKELRQKGHDGSVKTVCREKGKISFLEGGGGGSGIHVVFGSKIDPAKSNSPSPLLPGCGGEQVGGEVVSHVIWYERIIFLRS
jgi:hypothetical protein